MQQYRGRCHSIFKCNCLEIFINVVINKVQIETSQFMREPSEELEFIIKKILRIMLIMTYRMLFVFWTEAAAE